MSLTIQLLRVIPGVDQIRPALNTFVGVEIKKKENYVIRYLWDMTPCSLSDWYKRY
jgi:hypothetical protein